MVGTGGGGSLLFIYKSTMRIQTQYKKTQKKHHWLKQLKILID
jgi:hypothetical protein